jgi:hypothetical protein
MTLTQAPQPVRNTAGVVDELSPNTVLLASVESR